MALDLVFAVFNGAKAIGGVAAAVQVGEAVLHKTGLMDPGKTIIGEGMDLVLATLGQPERVSVSSAEDPPPQIAGPTTDAIKQRICVWCAPEKPVIVAGPGETIEIDFGRCEACEASTAANVGEIDALYEGWADSLGIAIDEDGQVTVDGVPDLAGTKDCKTKPAKSNTKYDRWNGFDSEQFYKDLSNWQKCIAKEKAENLKEAKDKNKAIKEAKKKTSDAQKKVAKFALAKQKTKYEQQIAEMQKAQVDAKTADEKAALQKQIDVLNAQALDTSRLQAETSAKAATTEQAARIDALTAQIANQAAKPGGMDAMMSKVMEMQMMKVMMAPPPAAADPMAEMMKMKAMAAMFPAAPPPPAAAPQQQLQAPPWQPQMQMQPMYDQPVYDQPMYDDGMPGYYYQGADSFEPVDPDIAESLGLGGASLTVGDAALLDDVRAQWSEQEFKDLMGSLDVESAIPGRCGLSSACGLK